MIRCINLRNRFGDRYKTRIAEPTISLSDPRYHIIPCKYGHIYPHGDDELGFASDERGRIAKRVSKLACTTVTQNGDDGGNVVSGVRHFDKISEIAQPRRRGQLSSSHRQTLIQAGQHTCFNTGIQNSFQGTERKERTLDCTSRRHLRFSRADQRFLVEKRGILDCPLRAVK